VKNASLTEIRFDYKPQPRQEIFHKAAAKQILYGGAAGGGKSAALRWDAIDFCLSVPGITAVVFRRTQPQLLRNHVMEIKRELPSEIGTFNETHKHFQFNNGSVLIFKSLEYDRDCEDIQGWEIHAAYVDEAGQLTPYMLDYIISRVRLGKFQINLDRLVEERPELKMYVDRLPRYALSANPGGESHHYLKGKFIDPAPPETVFYDESLSDPSDPDDKGWSTIYIPASMKDNKYLDAGYAAQFGRLPDHIQRQLRDGDWNVVPGAFFDCFDSLKHVIRPFAIPDHWTKFRAIDWGHATPFSVGWWAISDGSVVINSAGEEVTYPEGAMIRYREWYGCFRKGGRATQKGIRLSGTELAQGIVDMEDETINYSVADPSMWRSDGGPSQAERALKNGVILRKADNQRELGWQEMYRRLKDGLLFVFETCPDFVRTIPAIQADDKHPEDITKTNRGGEDHIADETRYACMSRPIMRKKPKKVVRNDGLTFNEIMNELSRDRKNSRIRI
jgi:hypothetical protein